jgi:hypothetical protein
MILNRLYIFCFQEILFYEDGEPKIDGEPGDLKVVIYPSFFMQISRAWQHLSLTKITFWAV